MSNVPTLLALASFIAAALSACAPRSGGIRPQILSFDYEIQTLADASARIDALEGGARVSDYLSTTPCRFRASFASPSQPRTEINGDPGDDSFNIWVISTSPVDVETNDNCVAVDSFDLVIGGPSESLGVGGTTSKTHFNVAIGGVAYSTSLGWFEASFGSFDPAPRYAGGVFRFLGKGPGDAIIIGEGAYAFD